MTPADKPRLLFIAPDPGFFVSHRLNLAAAAIDEGYAVAVASPHGPGIDAIEQVGAIHLPIKLFRGSVNPVREFGSVLSIAKAIRRFQPSLLHFITSKPVIYGGAIARLSGIPAVHAISGLGYLFVNRSARAGLLQRIANLGYRMAINGRDAHLIFQNQSDLSLFRRRGVLRHGRYILIAGSGVDLDRITPSPLPPGPPVVLLPARIIRDKGVVEFVEAARLLRGSGVEARFRLLGDPDPQNPTNIDPATIEAWVKEGIVEWRPHSADIGSELAQCHIVALPSYREGFPKSLIDAAAAGRVCVTSDVPGCRDAIVPGETGLLAEPRDARSLATVLRPLIEDRKRQIEMGASARRHAETHFGIERVSRAHIELYARAIGISRRSIPRHSLVSP